MKPLVLLTNDDGYYAPGLLALRDAVEPVWDAIVVAPDREQSAASHALTLNRPLRVNRIDEKTLAVDGTPTDCVMLSIMGLLDRKPDIVISGINSGANLGDDVIYSGTVAGAAEAVILGVPAVSVSFVDPENTDHEFGAQVALTVAKQVMSNSLPKGVFLNVNLPPSPTSPEYEVTHLGRRSYRDVIVEKTDPRGKPYYWFAGQPEAWVGDDTCDFAAIDRGNISVTPLHLDMTAYSTEEIVATWDFNS